MRVAGILLLAAAWPAGGQQLRTQPIPLPGGQQRQVEAADRVQFVSPDKVTVAARKPAQVDLHFLVAEGWHINSHAPLDKSLVPARLAVVESAGLNVTGVDFPPGSAYALQVAPQEKLSVYTGEFVLHAHLLASPGEHVLVASLRYQACDINACTPPRTIPVEVTVVAK